MQIIPLIAYFCIILNYCDKYMANHPQWSDEYWLLLMQLYMKKPIGIKPLYSRAMVDLALMLHIEPKFLYDQMFFLQKSEQPSLKLLWDKYKYTITIIKEL